MLPEAPDIDPSVDLLGTVRRRWHTDPDRQRSSTFFKAAEDELKTVSLHFILYFPIPILPLPSNLLTHPYPLLPYFIYWQCTPTGIRSCAPGDHAVAQSYAARFLHGRWSATEAINKLPRMLG